jgi:RNA polymerase sigma-54 factor
MRFDASLQQRLEQRMILAPRMIQAMEILQLPLMALQERIDQELIANPVLEISSDGAEPPETEDEDQAPAAPVAETEREKRFGDTGSERGDTQVFRTGFALDISGTSGKRKKSKE